MRVSILTLIACCIWTAVAAGPARFDALPKTVWTYSTPKGENIVYDLCIERLLAVFAQEQWILEIITSNNIRTYLRDYDNYRKTLLTVKGGNGEQQQLQLLKLYVLKQYGGLWLDPDVILFGNLSWIGQLPKLPETNTFQQDSYELVLFSTASTQTASLKGEKDEVDSYRFKQTAVMLALKNSTILNDWIERIKIEIGKSISSQNGGESHGRSDLMKDLSLRALHSLLSSTTIEGVGDKSKSQKNPLIYYRLWQFRYTDYQQMFEKFASTNNTKIIVDYYLKEDIRSIKKFSSSPKYFICLGGVSRELNYILNPSISSIQIMIPMPFFQRLWTTDGNKVKCTHYVMNHSLIYAYLVRNSKSEQSKLIPVHQRDVLQQCQTSSLLPIWNYLVLLIKLIVVLIILLLVSKIYRIVMGVILPPLLVKIKLKFSILYSSFFRLRIPKNSLQPI